jgi:hypothetical protein
MSGNADTLFETLPESECSPWNNRGRATQTTKPNQDMSLDWLAEKLPKSIRNYTFLSDKGEPTTVMHPKMEALIWLTLTLRMNYTGGVNKKREVLKRVQYLRSKGKLPALWVGQKTLKEDPATWQGADKDGKYILTDSDILDYWGLWTNSVYSTDNAFPQWKAQIDKRD